MPAVRPRAAAIFLVLGGLALMFPSRSEAAPGCQIHPRAAWVSATEVARVLGGQGLELETMRLAASGCYAVRARDARGRRYDLTVHPTTAEVLH